MPWELILAVLALPVVLAATWLHGYGSGAGRVARYSRARLDELARVMGRPPGRLVDTTEDVVRRLREVGK